MQKIEEIVGEVLDAMRRRGLREYTLKHENWSIYRPIINWHHKNGTEYYSEELLEGLCKAQLFHIGNETLVQRRIDIPYLLFHSRTKFNFMFCSCK